MPSPVRDTARVARVFEALTELSASGRPPTLTELGAAVGAPRATVRLDLIRLAEAGRVVRFAGPRGTLPVKGDAVP